MKALSLVALLLASLLHSAAASAHAVLKSAPPRATEAYATLVYGEDFVLAARVLGQSLRESGTKRDLVALTTGSLSPASESTLASDGWRVIHVAPVANPAMGPQPTGFPPRFAYVYTKLYIFKMTEYKKIVFLDGDILVMKNMDAIFKCPGFCAALRHSERFNSGVMTLVPSVELYDDMMSKVASMPSYTGGDQGFLNSYFSGFAHAPLFDPDTNYTPDQYKYMRLPTVFNADIGLFVVNSGRWMLPRSSLYVIHYTLGPFKPWLWWSSWLVREDPAWHAVRARLPKDTRGLHGGLTARQLFFERWMVALPLALAAALAYLGWTALAAAFSSAGLGSPLQRLAAALRPRAHAGASPAGGLAGADKAGADRGGAGGDAVMRCLAAPGGGAGDVFPRYFTAAALASGYGCVVAVTVATILLVPPEVEPLYGWILSYEWGFLLLGLTYGLYLRSVYRAGRRAGHHPAVHAPKHAQSLPLPVAETAASAAFLVASLLLAPWLGRLLRISSFAGTIVATVFIGLGVIVVATVQFAFLPAQWYVAGRLAGAAGSGPRAS
ncbi:hypothetical protein HYH03_009177 [Edaphochlamys debaryana]|uniref:Hexosyltransferase n=1 Tax=Edaphochlamys debaryana TaxID=47281 RepID=A0A835XWQ0_9CHLO|nr:hypothetical protein HYH03_009177 [Edaphochlamys debaryana]|eukprot:KAG2492512.1 hypothetical protein HYH03_009177 [Edaphochlamys debaryana]